MRTRLAFGFLWSSAIHPGVRSFSAFRSATSNRNLIVSQTSLSMSSSAAAKEPLLSPAITENRVVSPVPASAFVATVLAIPLFATTVLPLSVVYQVARTAVNAVLRPKQQPPQLDSGYVVEPSRLVPRAQRKYDLVVLGVTGFTGKLAARHLALKYGCQGQTVRWAIAGRSKEKLNKVKEELAKELNMEDMKQIDCIVVDTSVPSTLPALVEQTRVVATTAGPYSLYGSSVVEFCAKFGTHYVDITGEVDWVKAMVVQWKGVAQRTGAKLISFCGHDSIPWDLSVMKLQSVLQNDCNDNLVKATFWDEAIGGAPGGTFATALNAIDGKIVKPPATITVDPFQELPDGKKSEFTAVADLPLRIAKSHSPWDDASSKRWTMPFVMAPINAAVVRWSHALRRQGSHKLTYTENFLMPDFKSAFVGISGVAMLGISLMNPLTRYLVQKVIPAPGHGSSMEDMEKKHFLCVYGQGIGEKGNIVESIFYLPQDAGCLETSRMMVEAGLCLALQEDELPKEASEGGFWTPSTALGHVLEKRMVSCGLQLTTRVVSASH